MPAHNPTAETVAVRISETDQPVFATLKKSCGSNVVFNGQVYRNTLTGDWLGFYDWLRTSAGEVIGVQLWVDEPMAAIVLCRARGYVGVELTNNCFPFRVFFTEERSFDETKSCDQDFGSNMLFEGERALLLTFIAPATL